MLTLRTLALVTTAAAAFATASPALAATAAACPPTAIFNTSLDHLDGYRLFTGADGDTEVAPLRIDAKTAPLLSTGKRLSLLDLPTAPKRGVQIVAGPADLDLPVHPAPYKEMFILLAGSVTVTTQKFHADLKPGSVLLFEDVDAKIGHGGRTGPCGYVSISIAP